jgi:hypothetical protein
MSRGRPTKRLGTDANESQEPPMHHGQGTLYLSVSYFIILNFLKYRYGYG